MLQLLVILDQRTVVPGTQANDTGLFYTLDTGSTFNTYIVRAAAPPSHNEKPYPSKPLYREEI